MKTVCYYSPEYHAGVVEPAPLLAQGEGDTKTGPKVPLGVEARSGKLVFESKDGDFKWWIDSRIQIDGGDVSSRTRIPLSNGTIMRRATLALKSVLWKNWQAEIDMDFGDAVLDARDIWIRYNFPKMNAALQVGNFKEPFGLERLNSSRLLTFLERSTVSNAFPLGRRMGLAGRYWGDLGQVTVGVFGHELGTRVDKGTLDEGFSTNVRVSCAPINDEGPHAAHRCRRILQDPRCDTGPCAEYDRTEGTDRDLRVRSEAAAHRRHHGREPLRPLRRRTCAACTDRCTCRANSRPPR